MLDNRRAREDSEFVSDNLSSDSVDAQIRKRVQNRIEARSAFYLYLLGFLVINAMLWGIWLTSHGGFPWPVFITIPWGIGLMAQGWRLYQYSPESTARREAEIQREVDEEKRLMGNSGSTDEKLQRD